MTTSAARRTKTSSGTRHQVLRATVWALHVAVTTLVVFSLLCHGFDWWIDLRWLDGGGPDLTKIFWSGTVLVVPWCAGPRLTDWKKPAWTNGGWSPTAARWLLLPSCFVFACLIVNTIYYYMLWTHDQVDASYPVPMPLLAALLLGTWIFLTREWTRRTARMTATTTATRSTQIRAAIAALVIVAVASAFFLMQSYARPVTSTVDVAVVLGNRVLPDGTASVTLRDRTLAAVSLYHHGLARQLYLSGAVWPPHNPGGKELNEPLAMQQVCLDNGIPEEALTLDPVGENTRATAFDAARFMHDHNFKTVAVCTDQYHLYRSAQSLRELGIDARTAASHPTAWRCADPVAIAREMIAVSVYTLEPGYHKTRIVDMKLQSPRMIVRKAAGILELYDAATLIKKYACITGSNPGDKSVEGDRRTPIGNFHVVFKNPDSKFHLSLGLDYPTAEDAKRGLDSNLITSDQYTQILAALKSDLTLPENQQKLWYTALGGEIFIHGFAEGRTGTAGCIALSNPDIEELFAAIPLNTPIEIRP